jgi:hypothetical protein
MLNKRKMIRDMKKVWMLTSLLIVLASCSKEDLSEEQIPFSLSGKVSATVLPVTKADDLLKSSTLGVYILQTDNASSSLENALYKNVWYSANVSGIFFSETSVKVSNSSAYSALAYSPYKDVADIKATAFSHGEDVLYAPSVPVSVTRTAATAALTFEHKMSRVTFKIVSGLHSPDITNASLSVSGFYSSCTMDLSTGALTPVMGTGVTVTDAGKAIYIVPGSLNLNIMVTIGTRKYAAQVSYKAEASKDCVYTITVNDGSTTSLGVNCQIADWIKVVSEEL